MSKDTNEMYYSSKRQAFLVDQGYAFKVITQLQGMTSLPGLAFQSAHERRELLTDVILQNDTVGDVEQIDGDLFSTKGAGKHVKKGGARRTAGMLSDLSGGQDMAYIEYNKSRNKELNNKKNAHTGFLKKISRQNQRVAAAKKELQGGSR